MCDEPLYAAYLSETGKQHPGRDEIVEAGETDWRRVARWLTGPIPTGKQVFYQKHMAHHLLSHYLGEWLASLSHAFLIRDPAEMLVSFEKVVSDPKLDDTGLPQQWALYRYVSDELGQSPPVIDARDVLSAPEAMLRLLCERLDIPFLDRMLSWEAGPRPRDGIWAKYWYDNVNASTGFQPYRRKTGPLPDALRELHTACRPYYERLYEMRLTA